MGTVSRHRDDDVLLVRRHVALRVTNKIDRLTLYFHFFFTKLMFNLRDHLPMI